MRHSLRAWLLLALAVGCSGAESADDDYSFVEFDYLSEAPDVLVDRLCDESADPDGAPDPVFIHCRMEGASFAPTAPMPEDSLVVMAYNMERGLRLDDQLTWLLTHPEAPQPDVILAGEADRGCSRSGHRNVLWEYAEALGMNYVFATEFVELPREGGSGGRIERQCEHGNGILSRYPLGNVRAIRHAVNRSWYVPPEERGPEGEPRLGGRIAVAADIRVKDRILHAYSLHFESNPADSAYRDAQAEELAEDGLARPYGVVIGGDTNTPFYFIDLISGTATDTTVKPFFDRGYRDTHEDLPTDRRTTRPPGFVIDLIFTRSTAFSDSAVCPREVCGMLSDHLPIWSTLELD